MKNKKTIAVILIAWLLLPGIAAFSQGLGLGMRFGMTTSKFSNWSKLQTDDLVDASTLNPAKVGLQASFVLNPMFSKYFGMGFEFNFEQKGFKIKDSYEQSGKTIRTESVATYNYFTLPITFKGGYAYKIFSIYASVGPYVGVALGGKEKYYENDNLEKTYTVAYGEGEIDEDDEFSIGGPRSYFKANRLDVGLTLAFQPGVRLGPGDLVLDIRYNWGFLDINNPTSAQKTEYNEYAADNDLLPYYSLCNRSFGLSVGYIFRLGGK
jgi:hypothetical protein